MKERNIVCRIKNDHVTACVNNASNKKEKRKIKDEKKNKLITGKKIAVSKTQNKSTKYKEQFVQSGEQGKSDTSVRYIQ